MLPYNKIPVWENRHRVSRLNEFRNLAVTWFSKVDHNGFSTYETGESETARRSINLMLREVQLIVASSYVSDSVYRSPSPMVGGMAGNINIIPNMFRMHTYGMDAFDLVDLIDKSIGVYETDAVNSLLRTINPFFWLSKLIKYLASLPIEFIISIGIGDSEKVRSSIFAKITRAFFSAIFWVVALLAGVATLLGPLWKPVEIKAAIEAFINR